MYELLYQNFNKHVSLTPEECKICEGLFKYKKYRKHQYILQNGDVAKVETFILKGCTRTYDIDDKGQEHVLQFGVETWWVGNLHSFLTGTPSRYNIDCMEDTEVLQITKPDQERMYELIPKLERFFRILIQNAFIASVDRIHSNLSMTAVERYNTFINKYPQIEQRVPNHQIASYLGITPQSLSRIRSSMTKSR